MARLEGKRGMDEETMKEKPIIMSIEMVRATLEGRKSKSRRVIKPQPLDVITRQDCWVAKFQDDPPRGSMIGCPYGRVGDRLWVRERHRIACVGLDSGIEHRCYYADGAFSVVTSEQARSVRHWAANHPSIHMPRWASRITLEIVSLRAERLQEITSEDVLAEGLPPTGEITLHPHVTGKPLIHAFANLWDSLNPKHPWENNDWVWVLEWPLQRESRQRIA